MMPSTLNLRAPRLSMLAGDEVELDRLEALKAAQQRAMQRGRQSVRPAVIDNGRGPEIVAWLVQDVRTVAPKPEPAVDDVLAGPPWQVPSC